MKNVFLILFMAGVLASCKKSDQPVDNGCISRVFSLSTPVKPADSVSAFDLLKKSNLPQTNIKLAFVSIYNVPEGPNIGNYANVFVTQELKGLPMLSGDIWYEFKNDTLQSTSGTWYNSVNYDNNPGHTLPQLRAMYFTAVNQNGSASLAAAFKDSCLVAALGYYDLDVNVNHTPKLVKAWVIAPAHLSYPQVYVRDDNGALILYDRGVQLDYAKRKYPLAPNAPISH
jgi:hypothetical protein